MKKETRRSLFDAVAFIMALLFWMSPAHAFTLNVVGPDGAGITNFRWLVEEDNTHTSTPGVPTLQGLGVGIHKSHAPVMSAGDQTNTNVNLPADKRYFVSILPESGYSMGGASVAVGQTSVTVTVNPLPLPTAQVSVQVFEDIAPINNIRDAAEIGLGGFRVMIDDTFGQVTKDAFGNPLGTTYQQNAAGEYVIGPNGQPVVASTGSGIVNTGACPGPDCGIARIKNLAPGKYGVHVIPPSGQGWQQTSTIEGTKTIDAWVKANEAPFFVENGPPGYHASFGFLRPMNDAAVLKGGSTLSGRVVNMHTSRPPQFTFSAGHPIPACWVGLNVLAAGVGRGAYAAQCNADSTFSIPNVPPGDYQLAIWDANLDLIFATKNVTVNGNGTCLQNPGGSCAFGDIPVFNWFARLEQTVFLDANQNGFPDPGENGIPDQNVNLRYRDGSIYQAFPTDMNGYVPFDEVFPFFKFLVAEIDYARYKATGLTVVVDGGGAIPADAGWAMPSAGKLNPQPQFDMNPASPTYRQAIVNPNTGNNLSRTGTGPLLTQAFQGFLGSTSLLYWGKTNYAAGENGGITGIVFYATTRAENDPRYAVGDPWEPGVPRVPVFLYQDGNGDGVIDDLNGDGPTLSDVDHHPFGNFPGAEDVDHNLNGLFDAGDAIQIAATDSFDDAPPAGCQGAEGSQAPFYINGNPATQAQDCFEGLRTYNQVRDGLFDGGYAFTSYHAGGVASGSPESAGLPTGQYIVQATVPPGYILVKEEDRNVDFGDGFTPSPQLLPPECAGDLHVVPAELSLFPGTPAPFAGQSRPLCDRKRVAVTDGKNAAADFFVYTAVPKAARAVGFVLNDLGNEFNVNSPAFGEKLGPSWLPVAIRDFQGREISRVYSDQWGNYNFLVPSTYTVNMPTPNGVSPNMVRVCLNDPGPIPDPANPAQMIMDPAFQPQYTRLCYAFNFLPGRTTYLDTPIIPLAAFANATTAYPLDCESGDGTPAIQSVSGPAGGPHVALAGQAIQITAQGMVSVPNPAYDPAMGTPATVTRDYGFGTTKGTVKIGNLTVPDANVTWGAGLISVTVPDGAATGQLTVTRGDNGNSTEVGVTLTVGGPDPIHVAPGSSIQAAVDGAVQGDLILVPPGYYNEKVIVWKDVKLQGWGAGSTFLVDNVDPTGSLQRWNATLAAIVQSGAVDLLPGQPFNATKPFPTEAGAAVTVVAPGPGKAGQFTGARIDGFTLSTSGADSGGGIFVNGYAHNLQISNNRIRSNQGIYGGGIRVGHPYLTDGRGPGFYQSGFNDGITIHHNQVTANGAQLGAGGGIALYTGSDNYAVTENLVCGNFSAGNGAGIGHLGLSDGGRIEHNTILFNQSFNQMMAVSGGGLFVGGVDPMGEGAGNARLFANLVQGNQAGAGDGGGIRAQFVNGVEVAGNPGNALAWYRLDILDNIVVNNVAGLAGGGISLQDTVKANILNNTIAHNDSTATSGEAFAGNPNVSTAQPAGLVARAHSPGLANALAGSGYPAFSEPVLVNDILWQNRSFHFDTAAGVGGGLVPNLAAGQAPIFSDLAVLGATGRLNPLNSLLTDAAGYDPSNRSADPAFMLPYFNGGRSSVHLPEFTTMPATAVAFDEGGNFIDVAFGPITPGGNYHLWANSPAVDGGDAIAGAASPSDFDREARSAGAAVDIGADEVQAGTPNAPIASPVLAVGQAAVTHNWVTVNYTIDARATAPVVIAGPPTTNGSQPGVVRVRNVSTVGFQARFQEWSYLDGWHGREDIGFLVLQPGRYAMPDGSVWEVGTMSLSGNGRWFAQGFAQPFAGRPHLFLTAQTVNGGRPVTMRARNVTANGFEAALQHEEAVTIAHLPETVAYLAVYSPTGGGTLDVAGTAQPYSLEMAAVNHDFTPVLGGTAQIKVEEEQSKDLEVWHQLEDVAVMGLGGRLFAQDVSSRGVDPAALRRR